MTDVSCYIEGFDPKRDWDIWVLPLEGDKKPVPFLVGAYREGEARFSPDGHWVAYNSNESGNYEVYVRSFGMNSNAGAVTAGNFIIVLKMDSRWRSKLRPARSSGPGSLGPSDFR